MAPETKSREPANTAFKQQRLKAWQPILTPKTVLPTFFIVGVIFAPLGGLLLWASNSVTELSIDYTYCDSRASNFPNYTNVPSEFISATFPQVSSPQQYMSDIKWSREVVATEEFKYTNSGVWRCHLQFRVPSELKPPLFIYYRLTNFYQNHRSYVKSFNANQLKGLAVPADQLKTSCNPMAVSNDNSSKIIYPCGLIANSIFNDTISNLTLTQNADGSKANDTYVLVSKGISWPSDRQKYGPTSYTPDQIVPPPDWANAYPNGTYTADSPPPDLSTDELFQVWMRTAGLPDFRKLYSRNDTTALQAGLYDVSIDYRFPVTRYGGTKAFVLSTVSFLGGKNSFLGLAYIAVGIACVVLGAIFTARHLYKPRKLGDHTYLSWNNPQGHTNGN
ncbi:LEM3/CDC50 family protein [Gigaspora margarita]|uniref:LEM3/CDC50 family protein n=2 Tax=Gigaspora margarita TaxID=4874 RepID=A0A8H4EKS2_GIGMA|nr:LEM3/CDC50 family protein [Gigaspora margarita]